MVGKSVSTYSSEFSNSDIAKSSGYSPVEVATLLCFIVGIIQVICQHTELFTEMIKDDNQK